MGVFDLIRSLFGIGGSNDAETAEVAVEQEPSRDTDEGNAPDIEESAAAGTDATASTDSMLEEPTSDPETAAEPAEAGAGVTEHSGTETSAAEPAEAAGPTPEGGADEAIPDDDSIDEDDSADEDDNVDADDANGTESVDTIRGIGPAYADRLGDAGVETVAELLEADAAALAERTDLSEKRITGWQEQASS